MTRRNKPDTSLVLGILLSICIVLLAANLWQLSQPARPDPRLVALAVRATVYAVPTATPRIVEVTRVVEITVVAPTATATITPTATPVPQQSTVPVPLPLSLSIPGDNMLGAGAGSAASLSAKTAPLEEAPQEAVEALVLRGGDAEGISGHARSVPGPDSHCKCGRHAAGVPGRGGR